MPDRLMYHDHGRKHTVVLLNLKHVSNFPHMRNRWEKMKQRVRLTENDNIRHSLTHDDDQSQDIHSST